MRVNRIAILCFFAVYVIWGSTYLAIKYAIETLPAFGMSSARYMLAGILLYLFSLYKKEQALSADEKKISILSGILLIFANGLVCIVEYWVPSGIVAVIIGAMPIWMMLIGWLVFKHHRPSLVKVLGSLIGLAGVALITFGGAVPVVTGIGQFGPVFLIISSLLWVGGTLIQKKAKHLTSIFRFSSIQMIAGASFSAIVSLSFEKPWEYLDKPQTASAIIAFFYLVIFGSLIAFTAYSWLSRNVEPHLISTYALVNPIIAILLGSWFFKEPLSPDFLSASVLVIFGLSLLMWKKKEIKNEQLAESR
jgi:drug/metabolite transporter (DMT)-like permease